MALSTAGVGVVMLGLTLVQPFATAVALYGKDVENRGWAPTSKVLGTRIAIHAGAKVERHPAPLPAGVEIPEPLPRGAIVATAFVAGWLDKRTERERWSIYPPTSAMPATPVLPLHAAFLDTSRWWLGPVGILLVNVRPLRLGHVPCKGALGFWKVPPDVEARVLAAEGSP